MASAATYRSGASCADRVCDNADMLLPQGGVSTSRMSVQLDKEDLERKEWRER